MEKPKIGDTVYKCNNKIIKLKVFKVGRKYFYCKESKYSNEVKVEIEDWHEINCYGGRFPIYPSKELLIQAGEKSRIIDILRSLFGSYTRRDAEKLTYETLVKIEKLINDEL